MKLSVRRCVLLILLAVPLSALAESPCALTDVQADSPINAPDQVAWRLFLHVNKAVGKGNALFETWASDTDTFQASPHFPARPTRIALHPPILATASRETIHQTVVFQNVIPPESNIGEESRRNRCAFDYIVRNHLYEVSGLRAAYGAEISFPRGAIEVKASWKPVSNISLSPSDVHRLYHVSKGSDGKLYALVSMHIISRLVPNWTWATFEHSLNRGRCDVLGCIDHFGAQTKVVLENAQSPNQLYPPCLKSLALSKLMARTKWDKAFANYCLKGTQTDFTDNTGLATRLGNSVIEGKDVSQSSCMTCHARAAFDTKGYETSALGRENNIAPLGPINPSWFWDFSGQPPIFLGPDLKRIATPTDFVWSIPLCAYNDTANPPIQSPCAGS